jgi:CRISPR-associated protein Csx17
MTIHLLAGCQPTPLAGYLKALGVLRLVSEQRDPHARGRWTPAGFELTTSLTEDELIDFFVRDYAPTPIVAPWNGGSGYYAKDNQEGIGPIEASDHPRFERYRRAIAVGRAAVAKFKFEERPAGDDKAHLLTFLRAELDDDALPWVDAVVALTGDGPRFPPLLGTGGNDGRLDFTNNQMQRLAVTLLDSDPARAAAKLRAALFAVVAPVLDRDLVGQFAPAAGGGANAGPGFDGVAATNVWDYILSLEGTVAFAAAATRRDENSPSAMVFPFTVRSAAAGYASAAAGETDASRDEIWLPLWRSPASMAELTQLFGEGRAKVGRRSAVTGVDFARAIASLGTDRGVYAFERYGFHVRNGLAYFAVPLGTWQVGERTSVDLLGEIDNWLENLRRAGQHDHAPAALARCARAVDDAIMTLCQDGTPRAVQDLLIALGEVDKVAGRSPGARELLRSPLPMLSADWAPLADDQTPEYRLARALAACELRGAIIPYEWTRGRLAWSQSSSREVVWTTDDLVVNLGRVLRRRALKQTFESWSVSTRFDDLALFIDGEVDDRRIEALVRGLALVSQSPEEEASPAQTFGGASPAAFPLLRAAYALRAGAFQSHDALTAGRGDHVPTTGLLEAALAGDLRQATRLAERRLRAAGARLRFGPQFLPVPRAKRVAAALAFPLSDAADAALRTFITVWEP